MKTQNFVVKWKHEEYVPSIPSHLGNTPRKQTICTIEDVNKNIHYSATVKQYFKDTPNRRVGNKEAFKRAVGLISDKTMRVELWEGFKSMGPKCIDC